MSKPTIQPGDEIRVIAPSQSGRAKRMRSYDHAKTVLEAQGFRVTFGRNIYNEERFRTASVADRLADLHDAYRDPAVRMVIALHGGWSANALLAGIDWELIRQNPKPFVGFSDLTVLVNALYAQTGRVQYLGPTFSTFGHPIALEYTLENFLKVVQGAGPLTLMRSRYWQKDRKKGPLVKARPWKILQPGTAEGVLVGGNLGTFYLLQGTPWQPHFDWPMVLAVEDDDEAGKFAVREFSRRLESILQLPGVRKNLRGLLVGRFQPSSRVTLPDVRYIVQQMHLGDIPVVADMDFGHTAPMLTLPIGGTVRISTENNRAQLNLLKYEGTL